MPQLKIKLIYYFLALNVIIYMLFSLCACEKKEPSVSPNPEEVVKTVIETLELSGNFSGKSYESNTENRKLSEDTANELYSGKDLHIVDLSKIEKYFVTLCSDDSANEIGVFKVYSKASSVSYVEDMIKNRIASVQQKFKDNLDEEYDKPSQITTANSGEVRTYGNYIYYVIHPEKDKIFEKIEDIFRGS